jgi:HK97 family phage prohead protease
MNFHAKNKLSGGRMLRRPSAPKTMKRNAPRDTASRSGPPAANQSRAASIAPGSYDPSSRTIRVILSTGAAVKRYGFVEELSLDPAAIDLNRVAQGQVKLLDSHNQGSIGAIIGTVTSARFEGGALIGEVALADNEAARRAEADVESGHLKGVSIGYSVQKWTNVSVEDSGSETWRADAWTLLEASLVSVPADAGAMVRSASDEDDYRAPPISARRAVELINDSAVLGLREQAEQLVMAGLPEDAIRRRLLELNAEKARVNQIGMVPRTFANEYGRAEIMNTEHNAETLENPRTLREAAVAAGVAYVRGTEPRGQARELLNRYPDLLELNAAYTGVPQASRAITLSTSDYPIITAVGRVLMADAYLATLSPWAVLAREIDTPDFKGDTIAQLSGTGAFKAVGEGGEIQGAARFEEGETVKVGSYAQQLGMTRQLVVNSGGRVVNDIFPAIGKGGANALNDALTGLFTANSGNGATLADGNPTFTTTRGNKAATPAVISVTSVGIARKALRTKKEADGVTPIRLNPKYLVVSPDKEAEAETIVSTIYAAQTSDANPFAGRLQVLVDERLSGNAWYLFADPVDAKMITIAYLNGMRRPTVEERPGWDVLGWEYRGYFDFGVAITDWRPGFLNSGA